MTWNFAAPPKPTLSLWPTDDAWQDHDVTASIADQELVAEANGDDPYLMWNIRAPQEVALVSLSVDASEAGPLQLFWVSADCPEFAEECSVVQQLVAGKQPVTFVFDKPKTLNGLRLDIFGKPGSTVRFREIHLLRSRVLGTPWRPRPDHTEAKPSERGVVVSSKHADPWISVRTPWLDAKSVDGFELVLTAPPGTQPQLFWRGSACEGFSEKCSLALKPSPNASITHYADLAGAATWTGRIEELRLDPTIEGGKAVVGKIVLVAAPGFE